MNKLEGLPTIHYISLEESIGRRTNLENWFKQYNITNYVPHLFKRFEEYEYELVGSHVHLLNQHAKGPITSHLSVLREIYETYDDECFLIFEDDVSLKTIEHWNFSWKEFYKNLPKNWNCIQLIVIREYDCKEYIFEKRKGCDWCAAAYLIRRKYLKNLLELYYPSKNLTFNLDTHFLPKIENLLFANQHDGGSAVTENEIYSFPLFLEDCYSTKTTLDVDYDLEENGIRNNHCRSYNNVLNWWKDKGKFLQINRIMNNTIDCIVEQSELFDFSLDTENAQKNYNLAKWYEQQGHTAPAHTYYLRAAERSDNDLLAYTALLRASSCYRSQGSRPATEKILLENALNLLPSRPEAYYFLSLLYEKKSEWQNAYTYANLGLQCYRQEIENIDIADYFGEYQLTFQKAVCAWWWGKSKECRELFWKLVDEYWEDLDQKHKDLVEKNISKIGAGPESQSASFYDHRKHSQLRYIFKGSEKIKNNYSQTFQDMFVLSMLDGKTSGTFLEIGGAKPFERNNTALLEKEFQWTGVSIDNNENFVEQYKKERPNVKVLFENALQIDFEKLLLECYQTKIIDYLQLDIEPARNTYECLLKIPFDDYKFAVITYEHDHYIDITKSCRKKSREFLQNKGYVLVVNDISVDGISTFEDWWVHPDLVDPKILELMMSVSDKITNVTEYFYSKKKLNYYAEFETDKYIRENFFPDFNYSGIFVEVGAGPPEFISNSKHFRDSGWRTICVEPNPKFVKQHKEFGSEVYQYACSDQDGKSNFVINYNNDSWYSQENDGVSFSSLEIRYDGVPSHNTQEIIEVEKIKLNTLLEKINIEKIDVLSIDTEGWELDVMRGFDHLKYNPKVIVLENFENNKKYENFMQERGYSKKINLGYNEIYVKNSSQNLFLPNVQINNTSWIVDNFYENPDKVREFALNQDYHIGGIGRGYIGNRTHQQFLFPGLKERFEEIMGQKITKWEEHGMNGRFQYCWAGQPLVYHCDSQRWGGMLYLTPGAPYQCGTTLYAHKQTRARTYYDEGWDVAWKDIPGDPHLDGTSFEPVDVLGNVYNRLVIFDASCIHSASEYFGTVQENARLWQMFFFDT